MARATAMLRFLFEGAFGIAIAAGVFTGLTGLIAGAGDAPVAKIEIRKIEFTRLRADTPEVRKPRGARPQRPDRTDLVPILMRGAGRSATVTFERASWARPTVARIEGPSGMGAAGTDTELTPLVRIPPEYPPNGRGNGTVLVQFDVSKIGSVVNARVIESTPRGMFDTAALQAIARWRYRPAVMDGQAVERRGVQVRLRFELERA